MSFILNKKNHDLNFTVEVKTFNLDHVDFIDITLSSPNKTSHGELKNMALKYFPFLEDIFLLDKSNSLTGEPNIDYTKLWDELYKIAHDENNQIDHMKSFANKLRIPYDELLIMVTAIEDSNFHQKNWNDYLNHALKPQWKEELEVAERHIQRYMQYNRIEEPKL